MINIQYGLNIIEYVNIILLNMKTSFYNADEAFDYLLDELIINGENFDNTKTLFNLGFNLINPMSNEITSKQRGWKKEYAEAEWQWYLSGNRSIDKLGELWICSSNMGKNV